MLTTLHAQIARCAELADQLDAGTIEPDDVIAAIAALREAVDAHHHLVDRPCRASTCDRAPPTTALRDVLARLSEHLANQARAAHPAHPDGHNAIRARATPRDR